MGKIESDKVCSRHLPILYILSMIKDPAIAADVARTLNEAKDLLLESMSTVKETRPNVEYEAYHRAVGRVVAVMLFEIMEPLFDANPSIKPQGWAEK